MLSLSTLAISTTLVVMITLGSTRFSVWMQQHGPGRTSVSWIHLVTLMVYLWLETNSWSPEVVVSRIQKPVFWTMINLLAKNSVHLWPLTPGHRFYSTSMILLDNAETNYCIQVKIKVYLTTLTFSTLTLATVILSAKSCAKLYKIESNLVQGAHLLW